MAASDTRKVQLGVAVDASGAREGFAEVKSAARDMASAVAGEGQKAGKSLDTLGGAGAAAAKNLDSGTRNIIASIQRTTASLEAGEKSGRKFYESLAAQRGVDVGVLKPYLDQLDAVRSKQEAATAALQGANPALKAVGMSAAATSAALRNVPAQFTDIVVSLQAGQAPMTVLLQQGGQLKDMFGGIGPAARALGGYVAGLVNPFTLAAAGAAALGVAYYQGSREGDAYAKSILLTGNAAGVTTAQLRAMAQTVSASVGTQSAAADALAQFVSSGKVAAESLERFTATAVLMERNVGVAVKDTVKNFADLGKEPVEASKKLNEQYNYLTAAVYEQIRALKEQGDAQGAATLAQATYDTAMKNTAVSMGDRLGYIERAFRSAGEVAKSAWDKMLNVGREATPASQISSLQDRIAATERERSMTGAYGREGIDRGLDVLRNQLNLLQEQERMMKRGAAAQAERTAAETAGIAAVDALTKANERALTKTEQMNSALADYAKKIKDLRATNPNSALLDPAQIEKTTKAIREQFKERSASGSAGTGENETASLLARTASLQDQLQRLRTQMASGNSSEVTKLTQSEQKVLDIQKQLATSITGVARAEKERALAAAQAQVPIEASVVAQERQNKAYFAAVAETDRQAEAMGKSADSIRQQAENQEAANAVWGQGRTAIAANTLELLRHQLAEADSSDNFDPKYVASLRQKVIEQERFTKALGGADFKQLQQSQDEYARSVGQEAELYQDQLRLSGLTVLERAKIVAQRRVELDLAKRIAEIDRSGVDESQKEELRDKARRTAAIDANTEVLKVIGAENDRMAQQLNQSLTDALLRGFESGKGFAQNFRDTLKNMFSTLVLRPVISAIIAPVSGMVSGAVNGLTGGGGSMSGAGSALSWLTDFGGSADTAIYKLGGSLFKSGLESLGGTLLDNSAAIGQGLETLGNGLGYLNSILALKDGKYGQAVGSALGTYFGGPIGSVIGSTIGKYIDKAFGGETRVGGQFAVAFDGRVVNNRRGQAYTYEGQQYDRDFSNGARNALVSGQAYRLEGDPVSGGQDDAIRKAIAGTATGIGDMLKALGSKVTVSGFWAGLETSEKGRGGVFAGGSLSDGTMFGESGKGDNYQGTLYEKFSSNSPDFKTALENFTLDLKQSAIQALHNVGDIPESVKKKLAGVDAEALTSDAADALLTAINVQITGVTNFKSALDAMGMDKFAAMSFDAASAIGDLSGGFEKLQANLASYYENFYSPEERKANIKTQLQTRLQAAGLELPDIEADDARARYRDLIEKQNPATEEGQKTIAMLLELSAAFASVTKESGQSAQAIAEREKSIADKRTEYSEKILKLQGKDRELLDAQRGREYAAALALSPALAELANQMFVLEDAAAAAAKQKEIDDASTSYGDKILKLQGKDRELLDRQRAREYAAAAALGPEIAELANQMFVLEDAATAAAEAAAAQAAAEAKQKEIGDTEFNYRQRLLRAQGKDREALDRDRAREYARLVELNPALAVLANELWKAEDAATAAAEAEAARTKLIDDAFSTLERSVDARRTIVQAMQQEAQDVVSSLSGIFDTLKTNIRELYGEVDATRSMSAAQGQAFIAQALGTARTTGKLPEGDGLSDAIAAARAGLDSKAYASKLDYDRDRLVLAASLDQLKGFTGEQLTSAERQVKLAEDELKKLDDTLKVAKNQLDELRGVNTSVLSVADAVKALQKAMFPDKQPAAATPPRVSNGGSVVGAGANATSAPAQSQLGYQANGSYEFSDGYVSRTITGAEAQRLKGMDSLYARFAGSGDVKGYYEAAKAAGFTLRDVAAHDGFFYGDVLKAAAAAGVPAFARGGEHAGGLRLVGEFEPELEATGPARILNQSQMGAALRDGDGSIVATLTRMDRRLLLIESNTASSALHENAIKRLLQRVSPKGTALVVETAEKVAA